MTPRRSTPLHELAAHVAAALAGYVRAGPRDGVRVPPELAAVAAALRTFAVTDQQGPSTLDAAGCGAHGGEVFALPPVLNFEDAARELGVSKSTVERLARTGELPTVVIGGRNRRVRRADLSAFIDRLAPSVACSAPYETRDK